MKKEKYNLNESNIKFKQENDNLYKTIENQKVVPCLNKLKKIYKEKFINYQKEEIVKVELICIKLLNYKINLLTNLNKKIK